MTFSSTPSIHAKNVLRLLKVGHNVIISGPPATGKSRLLAEVRYWFMKSPNPVYNPTIGPAFPANRIGSDLKEWLPSPDRTDRKVFRIIFHQGTKYRDFVSGLIPNTKVNESGFKVSMGVLYKAAVHASSDKGASLLEIDEINRGPAVAVFGDTITAIEKDKRALPDGTIGNMTSVFPIINQEGEQENFKLPFHLYIIAAMNQADTSVEPLDVAFLRRFESYVLMPDEDLLRAFLKLPAGKPEALPKDASSVNDIFEVLVGAWAKVNYGISLLRGDEFQIGQGIFMKTSSDDLPTDLPAALEYAVQVWTKLYTHLSEVLFGDSEGRAYIIKAGSLGNPFTLENIEFGGKLVTRLRGPVMMSSTDIYSLLLTIAAN